MSVQTPPTLMQLARKALLRNEALAISALEKLPTELFPGLFKDAFHDRHARIVKAMVEAWPFPCLPVGTLMKSPNLETFLALLDGIDMYLDRRFHPRGEQLQVLDLRQVGYDFWRIWTGTEGREGAAETVEEKQVVKVLPRYSLRRRLKVIVELCLWPNLREEQACFLQWAQQRKDSLQILCTKMKMKVMPACTIKALLNFQPQHIEELDLYLVDDMSTLECFTPCLGQMRSLHKLSLTFIKNTLRFGNRATFIEEECARTLISQFSKFNCLQHLFLIGVYFLRNHMEQLLRCLTTPLETLTTTGFHLSQRDLDYFPLCHSLCQLKHLDMSGVILLTSYLTPLQALLEKVADTLQSLDLQRCCMRDSHLTVLIPALSQCSQLTKLNLYDNDFSTPTLKDLLHHTANLRKLSVEQYPVPLQCYDESGYISVERFSHICHELIDTLRARRQPKGISFATYVCYKCTVRCVYDQAPRLCFCWP
ncbi:PRAME family member 8-like [Microtus ochrogaster]|uniref:PRAME family member 8-like n=1 Tax=Microtus ochrogaster TaxID=79684 RepID=A0ABM0L612_MICOH|nr:PRAME family member 8-like [Microtus ochrogaster]